MKLFETEERIRKLSKALRGNRDKGAEAKQSAAFLAAGGEIYVPTEQDMQTFRVVKEPMREIVVRVIDYGRHLRRVVPPS